MFKRKPEPEPHNLTDVVPDDDARGVWWALCTCGDQLEGSTMLRAVKAWPTDRDRRVARQR